MKMLVTTEPANSGGKTFGPKYLAEQQSAVAVTTVKISANSSYKENSKSVRAFECKL